MLKKTRLKNLKIAIKIIILIFVTGSIPLYTVSLSTHFKEKQATISEINTKNALFAEIMGDRLEDFCAKRASLSVSMALQAGIYDYMKKEVEAQCDTLGKSLRAYLTNAKGVLITNATSGPLQDGKGQTVSNEVVDRLVDDLKEKYYNTNYGAITTDIAGTEITAAAADFLIGGDHFIVVVEIDSEDSLASVNSNIKFIALFLTITAILSFTIAIYFAILMTKPLKKLVKDLALVEEYDISQDISAEITDRGDEIGDVGKSVQRVEEHLRSLIGVINDKVNELTLASERLNSSSSECAHSADAISTSISDIASGASNQAQSTAEGAKDLNELGDIILSEQQAIESVDAAMQNVKNNVSEGLRVIDELSEKNSKSIEASKVVQEAVQMTNECAHRISEASTLIASIAEQTNLLSLNASIEAARAGEAGRGFAVVASEIQSLADQSTASTKNIDNIIAEIIKSVEVAVEKTNESAQMLEDQTQIVETTADRFKSIAGEAENLEGAVVQMSAAGKQVSDTSDKVKMVIASISSAAQQNAATTEEVTASVEEQNATIGEIANASDTLDKVAKSLEVEIKRFKTGNDL